MPPLRATSSGITFVVMVVVVMTIRMICWIKWRTNTPRVHWTEWSDWLITVIVPLSSLQDLQKAQGSRTLSQYHIVIDGNRHWNLPCRSKKRGDSSKIQQPPQKAMQAKLPARGNRFFLPIWLHEPTAQPFPLYFHIPGLPAFEAKEKVIHKEKNSILAVCRNFF
jgi:hypothetical protein